MKNNGSGYPEDVDEPIAGGSKLPSSSLVGDGGASWRLKALKRAREQAARDGRKVDEVCYLISRYLLLASITNLLLLYNLSI